MQGLLYGEPRSMTFSTFNMRTTVGETTATRARGFFVIFCWLVAVGRACRGGSGVRSAGVEGGWLFFWGGLFGGKWGLVVGSAFEVVR